MDDDRARGEEIMRKVLGEEYWQRRQDSISDFNRPFRELSASVAFGQVWSREGLEPKIRSLLCLAMLTALNRSHELDMHLRGAINNGCTVKEIQETLLQTAIYCGFPAAVSAYRQAETFLKDNGHLPAEAEGRAAPAKEAIEQPSSGPGRGLTKRPPR